MQANTCPATSSSSPKGLIKATFGIVDQNIEVVKAEQRNVVKCCLEDFDFRKAVHFPPMRLFYPLQYCRFRRTSAKFELVY